MKRALLFIDGSNLYGDWKSISEIPMDIEKFIEVVRKKFGEYDITRIYFYCTAIRQSAQDKFLRRIGYIPYVEVKTGGTKMKKVSFGKDTVTTTVDQGTDVNLAVDMVYHALKGHCDAVILVSRDSDFAGAVQLVKNEGVTCELCLLEDKKMQAQDLVLAADSIRCVEKTEYSEFLRQKGSEHDDDSDI